MKLPRPSSWRSSTLPTSRWLSRNKTRLPKSSTTTQQLAAIQEHDQAPEEQHDDTQQLAAIQEHDQAPEEQHDDTQQLAAIQEHDQAPEEQHDDTQQLAEEQPVAEVSWSQRSNSRRSSRSQRSSSRRSSRSQRSNSRRSSRSQRSNSRRSASRRGATRGGPAGRRGATRGGPAGREEQLAEVQPVAEEQLAEESGRSQKGMIAEEHVLQVVDLKHLGESDQAAEPGALPEPWAYGENVDSGWDLYIVRYPPTNGSTSLASRTTDSIGAGIGIWTTLTSSLIRLSSILLRSRKTSPRLKPTPKKMLRAEPTSRLATDLAPLLGRVPGPGPGPGLRERAAGTSRSMADLMPQA